MISEMPSKDCDQDVNQNANQRFREDLCPANDNIFKECEKQLDQNLISNVFTHNSLVKVVKSGPNSRNNYPVRTWIATRSRHRVDSTNFQPSPSPSLILHYHHHHHYYVFVNALKFPDFLQEDKKDIHRKTSSHHLPAFLRKRRSISS